MCLSAAPQRIVHNGVSVTLVHLDVYATPNSYWAVYLTELVNRHRSYRAGHIGRLVLPTKEPTMEQLRTALMCSTLLDKYTKVKVALDE